MFHHNTIRRYTLALLDLFNDIEIQYKDSSGALITKKVPVQYRNKEKYEMMDKSFQQEITGNMDVLPRGTLNFAQMAKSSDRGTSKFNKFTKFKDTDIIQTMFNPVPYDFTFDMSFICRGMNEACQIIEEIAPKFNPNIAIDVYDSELQDEPTRIPVQLMDINQEYLGLDELSMNVIRVSCVLQVSGWLFQPIKEYSKVKEFKITLQTPSRETEILNFDVIDGHPQLPPTITTAPESIPDLDTKGFIKPISLTKNGDSIELIYDSNIKTNIDVRWQVDGGIIKESDSKHCVVVRDNGSVRFDTYRLCAIMETELNNKKYRVSIENEFEF